VTRPAYAKLAPIGDEEAEVPVIYPPPSDLERAQAMGFKSVAEALTWLERYYSKPNS
jgi:hypothetical protein